MNYAYNKHTGEKIYLSHGMFCFRRMGCKDLGDALEKGWTFGSEDYEEPKEHWCINEFGTPEMAWRYNRESIYDKARKHIGNDFKTKEEAVKAAEKLKAWKRLKDAGFSFRAWESNAETINHKDVITYKIIATVPDDGSNISEDLALFLGIEEDTDIFGEEILEEGFLGEDD